MLRFLIRAILLICLLLIGSVGSSNGSGNTTFPYIQTDLIRPVTESPLLTGIYKIPQESNRIIPVWLFFSDKKIEDINTLNEKISEYTKSRSKRSLVNRYKSRNPIDFSDLPVEQSYINAVKDLAVNIRQVSRWFNAVSADIELSDLDKIARLPFVARIERVKKFKVSPPPPDGAFENLLKKSPGSAQFDYGPSLAQLTQINVVAAHESGYSGKGVIIAMFDGGVRVTHNAFEHIIDQNRLIAQKDFVFNDDNVQDEAGEEIHGHGTSTWSVVGGFQEGALIGAAYGASFILAKTEDGRFFPDLKSEEDNWIAAAEWVEELGADIISSSLVYLDFVEDMDDYSVDDLDGNTALITIAADLAVMKGITVVNAMGNDGPSDTSLWAPADGNYVISVGEVTSSGAVWFQSSRGPTADGRIKPDLMARGVSVVSASGATDSSFGLGTGTSLSTPLVAGAAALVLEAHPDWTALELREAMKNSASNPCFPNNDRGWGIVDAMAAINYTGRIECDTTSLVGLTMGNIFPNPSHTGRSNILVNIPDDEEYNDGVDYSLIIYNILGERVATVDRGFIFPNTYLFPWNHKNDKGEFAASGIYFAVLIVKGKTFSRKFAVLH